MKNPITDFYINDQNTENIIVTAKFVCGYVSIIYSSHGNYKNWIAKLNVYRRLLNNKLMTEACFFCLDKRNNNLSEEEIVNTMNDHDRFTLSYANLPTTAPKSKAAFIAGRLKSKSKSRTHMVKVNVSGFGVVEIDSGEYKGEKESDMHDFLKKIFQKIKPGSSYEKSFKGKFSLSTRDGIQLSERINTRGLDNLSPKEIKGIIRKSNYLNLVYAPLSLRPKKTQEVIDLEETIAKLEEKSNNSK